MDAQGGGREKGEEKEAEKRILPGGPALEAGTL